MEDELCSTEELEPPSAAPAAIDFSNARSFQARRPEIQHGFNSSRLRPVARSAASPFPESTRSREFRRRWYPEATLADWNNWHWQLNHRIMSAAHLKRLLHLSPEEAAAAEVGPKALPLAVTPYYASLLDPVHADQALRRTVVPVAAERQISPGEAHDPLDEEGDSPVPGIVHRYPDRALFLVTEFCATYCRYCTRSRMVGKTRRRYVLRDQWEQGLDYIAATPAVRDVLLSGGDPLTLPDARLEYLLSRLRAIPHVEMVRIGTKAPVVLPHRITPALTRMLKRYHPLWMSIHFTHPDELTPETMDACGRLADAGIPLGSQTVLLAGVNDRTDILKGLFQGLLRCRVRPYYLYQCDPVPGSAHFRTPVETGLEMIRGLRGHTTGYAVPTYVIDAPGGGGKVPLLPAYAVGREGGDLLLQNYAGRVCRYPDPGQEPGIEFASGRRSLC